MFPNQTPLYFATIRKLTIAFGTIFNNVYISRYSGGFGANGTIEKTIKVPLSWASGEKWFIHKTQNINAQTKTQTAISLPRIGFEMTGMAYDTSRKLATLTGSRNNTSTTTSILKQLNPVPYDFSFDVYIAAKNIDDGLQIIEQIVPFFAPSFNLNIKEIPELGITKDVPVILSGLTPTDVYEGSFEDKRVYTWTLSFVVKGYIYPPIYDAKLIKEVITHLYPDKIMELKPIGKVSVEVNPEEAQLEDDWGITTTIQEGSEVTT